jgi:hypothetical protein
MDAEIPVMLRQNIIEMVPKGKEDHPRRAWASVFSVPKSSGGQRFILNASRVNKTLECPSFRMTALAAILPLLRRGDWLTSVDLTSAFMSVPMAVDARPLLSFMYKGVAYQFRAMPFGLNCAPRSFTKMLLPVLAKMRELFPGLRIFAYCDDLLLCCRSREESHRATQALLVLLEDLGFEPNRVKSETVPTHALCYLGFLLDCSRMRVALPGKKRRDLRRLVDRWLAAAESGATLPTQRQLASLVGTLNSVRAAVPQALLWSGSLQSARRRLGRKHSATWETPVPSLPAAALRELHWWSTLLHAPGQVSAPMSTPPPSLLLETDASGSGGGFALRRAPPGTTTSVIPTDRARLPILARGGWRWPTAVLNRSRSICDLETLALIWSIRALGTRLAGESVLLLCDNSATVAYTRRGRGRVGLLRSLTRELFRIVGELGVRHLAAAHLAGKLNTVADWESRRPRDRNDWKLAPALFRRAAARWGMPTVDLFASTANTQLPKFYSLGLDPHAAGVDCFRHPWGGGGLAYANPPFVASVIARLLAKVIREKARVVLVLPQWPTAPWWPVFRRLSADFFVVPAHTPGVFLPGESGSTVPGGPTRWPTRIALVCGSRW